MARAARRRRGGALARLPPRRVRGALPRRLLRRPEVAVCSRGSSARHCRCHPLRDPWHRGTHRRLQRRRADDPRPRCARRLPRRARCRSNHPPHPGGGSVGVRGRAHPRRRRGRGLRGEAPEGRRPHELDQRRHLRTGACRTRSNPGAPHRVDRARDLPAHARGAEPALRDGERCVLDRHRDAREVPAGAHRRAERRARRPSGTGRPRGHAGRVGAGRARHRLRRPDRGARADRQRSDRREGARVVGSVVGAGVVLGSGSRLLRSVVHDDAILFDDAEAIDSVIGERVRASGWARSCRITRSWARRRRSRRGRGRRARGSAGPNRRRPKRRADTCG